MAGWEEIRRNTGTRSFPPITLPPARPEPQPFQLPIEPFIDGITNMVRENSVSMVRADTGTGKSTELIRRLLLAFRDEAELSSPLNRIWVANPRRAPCVQNARRVSDLLGTPCGEDIGWINGRGDEVSPRSKVVYITEGSLKKIILNQIAKSQHSSAISPKGSSGLTIYVFDESHQMSADGDIVCSLLTERMLSGDNTRFLFLSATLNTERILEHFSNKHGIKVACQTIVAPHFPIATIPPEPGPLSDAKIAEAVASSPGSITFLPGAGQMQRVLDHVKVIDRRLEVGIYHSGLTQDQQLRALEDLRAGDQRIISTNAIEFGMTLPPGVNRVISTGEVKRKVVGVDGEPHLKWTNSSRAEEIQRRGRVGRLCDGEHLYLGEVPLEELQDYPPTDLEGRLPSKEILELLVKGLHFDTINSKLISPASNLSLKLAISELRRAGLISSSSDENRMFPTKVGKETEKLPLDPLVGKIVALSKLMSEQLLDEGTLTRQQTIEKLLLPAINIAAITEAEGITMRESDELFRHLFSHGPIGFNEWRKHEFTKHGSDPIAQALAFEAYSGLSDAELVAIGLSPQRFREALETRADVCERLGIDPGSRIAAKLSEKDIRRIKECIWEGMAHKMYRRVLETPDADTRQKRRNTDPQALRTYLYKPMFERGELRTLTQDSTLIAPDVIVGCPITIDRKFADPEPARLITMATVVSTKWLRERAPQADKKRLADNLDKLKNAPKSTSQRRSQKYTQRSPRHKRGF